MIRVTLDTNTLASGAIAKHGVIAELVDRWRRGDFEIVVSEHILTELERTLLKPYFVARLSDLDREDFIALIRDLGAVALISGPIPAVLPDRADNIVLATASSGGASIIVTGDREMQALGAFAQVRILSPRSFCDLFGDETQSR